MNSCSGPHKETDDRHEKSVLGVCEKKKKREKFNKAKLDGETECLCVEILPNIITVNSSAAFDGDLLLFPPFQFVTV